MTGSFQLTSRLIRLLLTPIGISRHCCRPTIWSRPLLCVPFLFFEARSVAARRPLNAEVFGKPLTSCAAFAPDRAVGSPGVLPSCFLCVTVEFTAWAAASSKRLVTGTSRLCCTLVPHPDAPVLTYGVSVHPYALFVRPTYSSRGCRSLRSLLPMAASCASRCASRPPYGRNLCPPLPFIVTFLRDWTCSLIVPNPHDMLDAHLGFGTLAERTSKQPGKPGTQQEFGAYCFAAAQINVGQRHTNESRH